VSDLVALSRGQDAASPSRPAVARAAAGGGDRYEVEHQREHEHRLAQRAPIAREDAGMIGREQHAARLCGELSQCRASHRSRQVLARVRHVDEDALRPARAAGRSSVSP